jgi:hypothetical protein
VPKSAESITVKKYWKALRRADRELMDERDKRYGAVAAEREKALKIKEAADDRALLLAREIQTYKDEKANELRSQIERERGSYATQSDLKAATEKWEALIKPLTEFQYRAGGAQDQKTDTRLNVNTVLVAMSVLISAIILYAAFHK